MDIMPTAGHLSCSLFLLSTGQKEDMLDESEDFSASLEMTPNIFSLFVPNYCATKAFLRLVVSFRGGTTRNPG